jgi:hypothetical protein
MMEFEIMPGEMLQVLKRRMPRRKQIVKQGPLVTPAAGGGMLVLAGAFDNSWSVRVTVKSPGTCTVDLVSLLQRLKAYDPKTRLIFSEQLDGLKFGTTKLKRHDAATA